MEIITDHAARLLALLVSSFSNATVLRAIVQAMGEEVQAAEDTAVQIGEAQAIDTATGASLDVWGRILGARRELLGDDDYRALLRSTILAARCGGTVPEIAEIIRRMLSAPNILYYIHPPAGCSLWAVGHDGSASAAQQRRTARLLRPVFPVGTKLRALVDAPNNHFGFSDDERAASWGATLAEEIFYDNA